MELLIVYREEVNSMYFYINNLRISIYSDRYRYCTYCIFIPIYGKERDSEQKGYFILSITVLLPSSVFCFITQNCSTWSAELWTTMCVWKIEMWASVHQNLPQVPCRVHSVFPSAGSFWLALSPSSRRPQRPNADIGVISWVSWGMAC